MARGKMKRINQHIPMGTRREIAERMFGKRLYRLYDFCFGKGEANKEARELRGQGYLVRIIPAGDGYHIWRSKK